MKPVFIFFVCSLSFLSLHAVKQDSVEYNQALAEKDKSYMFDLKPLFSRKDQVLENQRKILKYYTSGDLRRLYYWTTPVDISDESDETEVFEPSTTLPFLCIVLFHQTPFLSHL